LDIKFTRRHYAKNIVSDEQSAKPQFPPEIFENIKHFKIAVDGYVREAFDHDTDEIIETDNYFTIISKDRKHIQCIRFDQTLGFEFEKY